MAGSGADLEVQTTANGRNATPAGRPAAIPALVSGVTATANYYHYTKADTAAHKGQTFWLAAIVACEWYVTAKRFVPKVEGE